MREIKFRAWDTKLNEWTPCGMHCWRNGNIPMRAVIADADHPIIIEQFTGLYDKNGKDRFDDDIIRRETGYVFVEKKRYFHLGPDGTAMAYGYDYHPSDEVIGNIHEHSYLLDK